MHWWSGHEMLCQGDGQVSGADPKHLHVPATLCSMLNTLIFKCSEKRPVLCITTAVHVNKVRKRPSSLWWIVLFLSQQQEWKWWCCLTGILHSHMYFLIYVKPCETDKMILSEHLNKRPKGLFVNCWQRKITWGYELATKRIESCF